jgi:hypothetical protein
MSVLALFVAPWLIGFPGILLAGAVDPRFIAACGPSGLLLIAAAFRVATDDRAWRGFVASQDRGRGHFPAGASSARPTRRVSQSSARASPSRGVLGVLAILGLHELLEQ